MKNTPINSVSSLVLQSFLIVSLICFSNAGFSKASYSTDPSIEELIPKTVSGGYSNLFSLVRTLTTTKAIADLIKTEMPELLQVNEEARDELDVDVEKLKSIPEHVFLMALRGNPQLLEFAEKVVEEIEIEQRNREVEEKEVEQSEDEFIPGQSVVAKYQETFKGVFLQTLREKVEAYEADVQLHPLELINPNVEDLGGIHEVQMFSGTPRLVNGEKVPADNLIKTVINFIESAEKELVFNIFDFDIMEIAEELIASASRGVNIRIGMDMNVIHERPAVEKVYNRLVEGVEELQKQGKCLGCKIHPVDSTSLNHQKLMARDWSVQGSGAVLTSSGNFTHSGLNPHGDVSDERLREVLGQIKQELKLEITKEQTADISSLIEKFRTQKDDGEYSAKEREVFFSEISKIAKDIPKGLEIFKSNKTKIEELMSLAIPNANHMVTYKSDSFAQLVNHELSKTIDMECRGRSGKKGYPFGSVYKIPRVDGKEGYILVSFSPNGGYGKINEMLANVIRFVKGPIKMLQFAFSSPAVAKALEGAMFKDGRSLKAVGDGPFALSYWSIFLRLSSLYRPSVVDKYKEDEGKGIADYYYDDLGSEFHDHPNLAAVRDQLRVAPRNYGTKSVKFFSEAWERSVGVTSKLHHKLLSIAGIVSTPGTSHNFSKGALSNQEQIIIAFDKEITAFMDSIFDYIYSLTSSKDSVAAKASVRNVRFKKEGTLAPGKEVYVHNECAAKIAAE